MQMRGSRSEMQTDRFGAPDTCRDCRSSIEYALPNIEPDFDVTRRCAYYIDHLAIERTCIKSSMLSAQQKNRA